MITTRRYPKPKPKKIILAGGRDSGGNIESESRTIAGTAVTDASAAITA